MIERSIEQQIRDLCDAGWTRINATTWRSPAGNYYRGPHGAWLVLTNGYHADQFEKQEAQSR